MSNHLRVRSSKMNSTRQCRSILLRIRPEEALRLLTMKLRILLVLRNEKVVQRCPSIAETTPTQLSTEIRAVSLRDLHLQCLILRLLALVRESRAKSLDRGSLSNHKVQISTT